MNPNLLPEEMSVGNQNRILREIQTLPGRLMMLKQQLDEKIKELYIIDANTKIQEFELEKAKVEAVENGAFADCKNDMQRKAYILDVTKEFEENLIKYKVEKLAKESESLPIKSEYDLTYQKFWALKTASEQISSFMSFVAAGEQP